LIKIVFLVLASNCNKSWKKFEIVDFLEIFEIFWKIVKFFGEFDFFGKFFEEF